MSLKDSTMVSVTVDPSPLLPTIVGMDKKKGVTPV